MQCSPLKGLTVEVWYLSRSSLALEVKTGMAILARLAAENGSPLGLTDIPSEPIFQTAQPYPGMAKGHTVGLFVPGAPTVITATAKAMRLCRQRPKNYFFADDYADARLKKVASSSSAEKRLGAISNTKAHL